MCETLYTFLLKLYPARFRMEYGNEALQLFRDRLHDEWGGNPTNTVLVRYNYGPWLLTCPRTLARHPS
jgi:hypothetical protein